MEKEDENQILENMFNHIKMTSMKMKNSIDRNDMRQVLKYSVDIINVLKTEGGKEKLKRNKRDFKQKDLIKFVAIKIAKIDL